MEHEVSLLSNVEMSRQYSQSFWLNETESHTGVCGEGATLFPNKT